MLRTIYWYWLILAIVLVIAEMLGAAGFLLSLGLAAVATALSTWLGDFDLTIQLLFFSVYSIVFALVWWYINLSVKKSNFNIINQPLEQFIGKTACLATPIENGVGKIYLNDSVWLVTGPDLPTAQRVKIIAVSNENLLVIVPV